MFILEPPQAGIRLEFEPEDITFQESVTAGRFVKNRERDNFNGAAHPERGDEQDKTGTPVEHAFRLGHGELPKFEDMVREDYIRDELDGYGAECRGTKYVNGQLLIQGEWEVDLEDPRKGRTVPFSHGPDGFIHEIERSVRGGKDKKKILAGVPFVLGILHEHCVDFRGFYIPKNRLRRVWWREDFRRPCYGVPQMALFSLIPFFDETEGVFREITLQPRVLIHNWYLDERGRATFDRVRRVPVGEPVSQEEADQTGMVIVVEDFAALLG
jgi:hypothetical protein